MNETPIRLPLRLAPQPEESLAGFVMRLATHNLFRSPTWIAEVAGVSFPYLQTTPCDLQNLSVIAGINEKTLRGMVSWPEADGMVHYRDGLTVPHRLLPMEARRFCPLCMKESPFHRAIWDVKPLDICPIHGVKLEAACRCGRPTTWRDQAVDRCECGSLLCQRATRNTDDKASALCMQVWHLAGISCQAMSMPRKFWNGPLNQVLEVLACVGTFSVGEEDASRKSQIELAAEGHALLADWPRSYSALIFSRLQQAAIIKPFVRELLGFEASPFAQALLIQYKEIVGALPPEIRLGARLPLPRLSEIPVDDPLTRLDGRFYRCGTALRSGSETMNPVHHWSNFGPSPWEKTNGNWPVARSGRH